MHIHDGILFQLVKMRKLTETQIEQFIMEHAVSIDEHQVVPALLKAGIIDVEQIAMCTGLHYKVGYVNLRMISISPETIDLMTYDVARFLRCIPFHTGIGRFCVAVEDITEGSHMDSIRHFFGDCGLAIASKSSMDFALNLYYPIGKPKTTPAPTRRDAKSRKPKEYPWNMGAGEQLPLIHQTTHTGTNAVRFVRVAQ